MPTAQMQTESALLRAIPQQEKKTQTMTPTPRTDAEAMDGAFKEQGCTITLSQWDYYKSTDGEVVMADFARQLERDIHELNERLIDRQATLMSQALKIISLQRVIESIYDRNEGFADGAPDASPHDKLCNEISSKLKPFIK